MLVTEDLYVGYHDGFPCVDASQHSDFTCKVVLLLLAGDYPALAKATGFTHSGDCHCHWCHQSSGKDMAVNRHGSGNFRRWLQPGSMQRAAGGNFSHVESEGPPRLRNHREVVRTGVQGSHWTGTQKLHPRHTTGIWEWSPLSVVPNFDIVWDAVGDFMHVVLWYPHHLLLALKGEVQLAHPTLLALVRTNIPFEAAELSRRKKENERRVRDNVSARKVKRTKTLGIILSGLGIIPTSLGIIPNIKMYFAAYEY